jgi:Na+-driven multidrug efflux pump
LIGPILGYGLTAVWIAQVGYRGLQALVFAFIWRSRMWIDIEV